MHMRWEGKVRVQPAYNRIFRLFASWRTNVAVLSLSLTHLAPDADVPAHRTIKDVAVLPVDGRRLWTHVIRHRDGIPSAARHLVDAGHLAGLYPKAAGILALRELARVPSVNSGKFSALIRPDSLSLSRSVTTQHAGRQPTASILCRAAATRFSCCARSRAVCLFFTEDFTDFFPPMYT